VRSEKLLIVLKHKFLGDAVMATPLLYALRDAYPTPSVLAAPHIQEMLQADASALNLITPGSQRGLPSVWEEAKRLRGMKFDSVLLVNRSFRSAMTARLAGIPKRIGHDTENRGFLLTQRVPYKKEQFEGEAYGDLGRAMSLPGDYSRVRLSVTRAERERGRELLRGATIGLQPGARYAAKTLPLKGLAGLVDRIRAEGHSVALIGGKEETAFGSELEALISQPVVNLIGQCSLRESMGVVANLSVMIGGSTGIMHIAAALATPTVTVFGPTDSLRWGHAYAPHQTVQIPSREIQDMDPVVVFEAVMQVLG
jgi:heptosyltransferase-2